MKFKAPKINKPNIKKPDIDRLRIDEEQKKDLKRFVKRRYKEIIIVSVLVFFFLFSVFHKERTMLLMPEKSITSNSASAYVFTESEYVDLEERRKINYTIEEGQKVGANTKLSKDYMIETNKFLDEAIALIDWRLEHKEYQSRDAYFKRLKQVESQIISAQSRYDSAKSSNDSANMDKYENELKELKNEQLMLHKSMRYIYADVKELKKMKKELNEKKKSKNKRLTTSNLNISFAGNIFFERTGYEEAMNLNILPSLDDAYIRYLNGYKPESTRSDVQIIKVVNDEAAYVFAFLDKKTYVSGEDEAKKYHESVKKNHKLKTDGQYYDYLLTRIDMLITYPTITVATSSGEEYEGYLVNVADYKSDKKMLAICIKKQFTGLMNKDKTKLDIYTDVVTIYRVPKKAIVKKKDKTYLYRMSRGNIKERVEVTVYKEDGSDVLLRPYNNENLADNMEIVVNPM